MTTSPQKEKDQTTDLSDVKPSEVFFKYVSLYQKIEKISAAHVLQNLSKMEGR